MSSIAWLVLSSLTAALGLSVLMTSTRAPRLSVVHLDVSRPDLAVLDRSAHEHTVILALSGGIGFALAPVLVGIGTLTGVMSLGIGVPAGGALLGGLIGVATAVHTTRDRVRDARLGLRHQLTAYVDMVTMLVAGDNGHESALEQAAAVGDGRLFDELRRSLREQATRGASLVNALEAVADRFALEELRHVASTISIAGAEGAPVVRSLTARAASLRSALAGEQEIEARLRTSRLTGPIVGMALVFMVLVIYPALSISPT